MGWSALLTWRMTAQAVISYFTLSNDQVYRDPKALDEFADLSSKTRTKR